MTGVFSAQTEARGEASDNVSLRCVFVHEERANLFLVFILDDVEIDAVSLREYHFIVFSFLSSILQWAIYSEKCHSLNKNFIKIVKLRKKKNSIDKF